MADPFADAADYFGDDAAPMCAPLRCRADVDAMTLLFTVERFRLVERSWVAAGASRRPRGAHLARRRLVAPVLSLAALYF